MNKHDASKVKVGDTLWKIHWSRGSYSLRPYKVKSFFAAGSPPAEVVLASRYGKLAMQLCNPWLHRTEKQGRKALLGVLRGRVRVVKNRQRQNLRELARLEEAILKEEGE